MTGPAPLPLGGRGWGGVDSSSGSSSRSSGSNSSSSNHNNNNDGADSPELQHWSCENAVLELSQHVPNELHLLLPASAFLSLLSDSPILTRKPETVRNHDFCKKRFSQQH